jgi:hypothetical protein
MLAVLEALPPQLIADEPEQLFPALSPAQAPTGQDADAPEVFVHAPDEAVFAWPAHSVVVNSAPVDDDAARRPTPAKTTALTATNPINRTNNFAFDIETSYLCNPAKETSTVPEISAKH